MHDAVDEMLRFDSPVQTDFRIAKARSTLRREVIEPGDGVTLLTGSANRDDAAFTTRTSSTLPGRARGTHRSGIASTTASARNSPAWKQSMVFAEALRSAGKIEVHGDEPRYRPSTVIRGLAALPLRVVHRP